MPPKNQVNHTTVSDDPRLGQPSVGKGPWWKYADLADEMNRRDGGGLVTVSGEVTAGYGAEGEIIKTSRH
jgi:hypothetical protein